MRESIKNINDIASNLDTSKDFDAIITKFASKIISPQTNGLDILETGCSTGEMTKDLINYAKSVSVVEGSKQYAECVRKKFGKKLTNDLKKNFFFILLFHWLLSETMTTLIII